MRRFTEIYEKMLDEEKSINEEVNICYYDDYNSDITDTINIIIDTENLYLCNELSFPCLKLLEFLQKQFSKEKLSLHFITKTYKNTRVVQEDIFRVTKNKIFSGEYKMKNRQYKESFRDLDEITNTSSIYFYSPYKKNLREIDDLFLLYLVYKLSRSKNKVYFYSNDYKMINDHILSQKITNINEIEYSIYKYIPQTLNIKLFRKEMVNFKHFFSKDDSGWYEFWKNINYIRINKLKILN